MSKYCVYKHTSPSGKVYIGITCQKVSKRWNNGNGYQNNPHFFSAIKKHGWNNFTHEVLFSNLSKEDAEAKEIELIATCDSTNPANGYNHERGGNLQGKTTEAIREKISQSRRGKCTGERHPMYGKKLSAEQRKKLSIAHCGKRMSEETRKKISEATRGEKSAHYGKHHSEDAKKKMSASAKNRPPMSDATRAKIGAAEKGAKHWTYGLPLGSEHRARISVAHKKQIVCVESGVVYDSALDAERITGVNKGNISSCLTGKRKTAGGFSWQYAEKVNTK